MNQDKPICCDRPMRRNGKTKAGKQRYRCSVCDKAITDSEFSHGGYRHGVEGRTGAERVRDSRKRTRKTGNEKRKQT